MRTCGVLVLLSLAGCAAPSRRPGVQGGAPQWDWPFEAPAWFRTTSEGGYEGKLVVLLHCEFVDAGSVTSQLADLLELSDGGAAVLSEKQAAALKRIALGFGRGSIVSSPRVLAFESQAACVAVMGPAAGRTVYLESSDVTGDAASVRFAVQVVAAGHADKADLDRSWSIEGRQTLRIGQAVVRLGGADKRSNPELVIVRLADIRQPEEASDTVARRHSITAVCRR
jgi:hypothetical protein